MENPLHDLIIGNIDGAKLPMNLDFRDSEGHIEIQDDEICCEMNDEKVSSKTVVIRNNHSKNGMANNDASETDMEFEKLRNINFEQ
jgi:hypothetical protein